MIAIRVIIEVIIFIYMMGLSIGLRKQKIKKTQRIKMIRNFFDDYVFGSCSLFCMYSSGKIFLLHLKHRNKHSNVKIG